MKAAHLLRLSLSNRQGSEEKSRPCPLSSRQDREELYLSHRQDREEKGCLYLTDKIEKSCFISIYLQDMYVPL